MVESDDGPCWTSWSRQDNTPFAVYQIESSDENSKYESTKQEIIDLAIKSKVKLIIIDTKNGVESNFFKNIPHLLIPPVTKIMKAYAVLEWVMTEVQNRYNMIIKKNCSNIDEYNQKTEITEKLPEIVVIIDEFEELCESEFKAEIEELMFNITRSAEKVGIYFIVSWKFKVFTILIKFIITI